MSKIKILLLLILLISLIIELYRLNQNTHTGCFFNWSSPKNHKFFSVSKMFPTFELVPP